MKYLQYVMMGFALGVIHGLVLWAAIQTLGFASWMITKSTYTLPLQVTAIIDATIIVVVISAVWWLPKLEQLFLEE